ncbi:hypothetical protein KAW38_04735 [Candidatus Micrarchaeota archaeon]|nr:hypothetical protein [Candidatus Micrarchaeota archaeon]
MLRLKILKLEPVNTRKRNIPERNESHGFLEKNSNTKIGISMNMLKVPSSHLDKTEDIFG